MRNFILRHASGMRVRIANPCFLPTLPNVRTPTVRQVDDDIKYGMIEAISHLIHRDYDAIVKDFVTLDFIPEGTDLKPILPVLAKASAGHSAGTAASCSCTPAQ